jgi:pseudouridine-5'-phosphate glycosidase
VRAVQQVYGQQPAQDPVDVAPEVARALADGRPVVALESTVITHGLPRPQNLAVATALEDEVRAAGAVPATIAVLGGRVLVGCPPDRLAELAQRTDAAKVSVRDLAAVVAAGGTGGTTVAATAWLAARAGIAVFATGGVGGVHRDAAASFDESADLVTLASVSITLVCAGVKSILDVGATLERLETLSVPVFAYRTDRFPGFYLADSGFAAPHRVDTPAQVAAVMRARDALGLRHAVVVAQPVDTPMDPAEHDRVLAQGLAAVAAAGLRGAQVTPALLEHFHAATAGHSVTINTRVLVRNARLGAQIAVAVAQSAQTGTMLSSVAETTSTPLKVST